MIDYVLTELIPLARMSMDERLWFSMLLVWICYEWFRAIRSQERMAIWQPRLLLAAIFFYYCVLGPVHAFQEGSFSDRGVNLRYVFSSGWTGAVVAAVAFCAGDVWSRASQGVLGSPRFRTITDCWWVGFRIFAVGILLYATVVGLRFFSQLNPFSVRDTSWVGYTVDYGAFRNYAGYGLNVAFVGCGLMFASSTRRQILLTLSSFFVLIAVSTTIGFRYRILVLVIMVAAIVVSGARRKVGVVWYLVLAAFLIFAGGYVGATRTYGSGLDANRVEDFNANQYFAASVSEASVFMTTGAVVFLAPRHIPFIGAEPILAALMFPLPRSIAPWKGSANYIFDATSVVYGSPGRASGAAFLSYAEYYLMFGWAGVVVGYGLLGWLYGICWRWFLSHRDDPIVRVCYALTAAFLYVVVSRGYLSQVLMLFCFTVLPAFILHRYYSVSHPAERAG